MAASGHGKNRFQLQTPGQRPGGPKAISYQLETHGFAALARVFLETEIALKARRILDLSCDVFIDDLPEFLVRADLSSIPRKILFRPGPGPAVPLETVSSWNHAASLLLSR